MPHYKLKRIMRSLTVLLLFFSIGLSAQSDTISIKNGSFEDEPRAGAYDDVPIESWFDCGAKQFPRESAPDIHPIDFWQVTLPANKGETYLGIVARDNESWESVSQRLTKTMMKDKCYQLSVDLARSASYLSGSRTRNDDVKLQYTKPAILNIWGANEYCSKRELLATSKPIDNTDWVTYDFELIPFEDLNIITLEVHYADDSEFPYNGHILIDGLSDLIGTSCPKDEIEEK